MATRKNRKLYIYLKANSRELLPYDLTREMQLVRRNYQKDVITALMHSCDMNMYQAEQCAMLLTYSKNHECQVYYGKGKDVLDVYKELSMFGLTVELRTK